MSIERLFGDKGQYIGYIQEDSSRVSAFGEKGEYLGSYWKTGNQTCTDKGVRVCFGNGAQALVINNSLIKK